MLVVFLPYFGVGEKPMIDFYSNLHSEGYLHSGGPTLYIGLDLGPFSYRIAFLLDSGFG